MSEDDWWTSNHGQQMLAYLRTATVPVRTRWLGWKAAQRFPLSERKVRLVETACCERIVELLPSPQLRNLIGVARQQVEDEGGTGARSRILGQDAARLIQQVLGVEGATPHSGSASFLALAAIGGLFARNDTPGNSVLEVAARARAVATAERDPSAVYERRWHQALMEEYAQQADIVRDVIGNPFRREPIDPEWLRANDRAAARIAEAIAGGGMFADLPILADALEDAGCTSQAILDHCRGPGPHVEGCWVIDGVLGKG